MSPINHCCSRPLSEAIGAGLHQRGGRMRAGPAATLALLTGLACGTGAEATTSIIVNTVQDPNPTPGSSASVSGSGNIVSKDPQLGPLRDNGGSTLKMLPAVTSPVIDAGTADSTVDQRGAPRPAGAGNDMGAVERQYPEQLIFRSAFNPP